MHLSWLRLSFRISLLQLETSSDLMKNSDHQPIKWQLPCCQSLTIVIMSHLTKESHQVHTAYLAYEVFSFKIHCKMKRAKLTPISRGPVWPIKVRFGLFEPKRAWQVPFRPLQNLNWPLWILLWNFFSIWPFQEPSRIDQFGPNEVQFLKKKKKI